MHGWLTQDWTYTVSNGLNVLVAWIYSGGSISRDTYKPLFAVDTSLAETILERAFDRIGLDYRLDRSEEPDRATEAIPTEHASILGRTLVAWGAPAGSKNEHHPLSLPAYLWEAPADARLDFARTYLLNRGHLRADRPDNPLQIGENRSSAFREELQALFRGVVDSPRAVRLSGENLMYVYPDAADELFMPPTFGEDEPQG